VILKMNEFHFYILNYGNCVWQYWILINELIPKLRIKFLYFEFEIIDWSTDEENSYEILMNIGTKSEKDNLGRAQYIS
jgi:hypothetical protein